MKLVGMDARANVIAGGLPIGERKKLEVARALATGPRMVLFDEVMGGLNSAESGSLATRSLAASVSVSVAVMPSVTSLPAPGMENFAR